MASQVELPKLDKVASYAMEMIADDINNKSLEGWVGLDFDYSILSNLTKMQLERSGLIYYHETGYTPYDNYRLTDLGWEYLLDNC